MKRYLKVYLQFVLFSLKSRLEYRLNFAVQLMYGPAYIGALYLILEVVMSKTPEIGGLTRQEMIMIFATCQLSYSVCLLLFVSSLRDLLLKGLRLGEVDIALTKPLNPPLYLAFSKPSLNHIILIAGLIFLLIRQMIRLQAVITPLSLFLYFFFLVVGIVSAYFCVSIYSTLGFFMTRAKQIIDIMDKTADYGQYPPSIFPSSVQLVIFTVVPTFFFGYLPGIFLLNKGSWQWATGSLIFLLASYGIYHYAWKEALKHYSSASS